MEIKGIFDKVLLTVPGTNLVGANLEGANLRYADLRGADLRGAIIDDADGKIYVLKG